VSEIEVVIRPDGTAQAIYSDEILPLAEALGPAEVRRASHVEPAAGGGWTADLGMSSGPVLGPFRTRQEALAAEVAWIRKHVLRTGNCEAGEHSFYGGEGEASNWQRCRYCDGYRYRRTPADAWSYSSHALDAERLALHPVTRP
jgi:hypothetical protein